TRDATQPIVAAPRGAICRTSTSEASESESTRPAAKGRPSPDRASAARPSLVGPASRAVGSLDSWALSFRSAPGGSLEKQVPLANVPCQPGGLEELLPGLGVTAESGQQVAANGRQQVIIPQRRLVRQRIDDFETGHRAESHGDS